MNLQKAFLSVLVALAGVLAMVGGATLGALSASTQADIAAYHRQQSLALMSEVRHEVDLLGRLVSSYVGTANPRFLIYYYDVLAIREGSKVAPTSGSTSYWERLIGGQEAYVQPVAGHGISLPERASQLGFDAAEAAVLRRVLQITEQMKEFEQIAFAATQGLYDPVRREFVSDAPPHREFANALLHEAPYLKLRSELAVAVDELAGQVDQRTARSLLDARERLHAWIVAGLLLLLAAAGVLVFSFFYLKRHLLAPLTALHRTAMALAGKAYGVRVGDLGGVEEVQTLGATIDNMAAAIEADIEQREVVQRALRKARARAEVAAEAKSIFLANMSHEIRTPMNAILGMAYLALQSGLPPRQHDYVAKIHAAARSLLGILNDILDFSKIEAGKVALERVLFDLEPVVQNALFMVQQRADSKRIELIADYRVTPASRHLLGDPLRLGQILINLLSNAVKFTEAGHVRLTVTETACSEAGTTIEFRVEDTGIGMTQEQIGRLFQEFSQADGSTTRRYGGTGLGLAISKRLLGAMGGTIEVDSTINRGSVFHFTLQLPLAPMGTVAPEMAGPLACRRVLVVDDYPLARDSMAEALRRLGCMEVDLAADGAAAIGLLATAARHGQPYELLLLDWGLPDMTGGELLEALRTAQIPVPGKTVILSTADAELLRREAGHQAVSTVLQKPLLPTVLRRICAPEAMNEPGAAHTLPAQPASLAGMPVLLVEDNEVNQQVACEMLRGWGARVDVAANGQQALDRIAAHQAVPYAVILMDIEMPVMDGREATCRLREDPRFASLPIIAMTAHVPGNGIMGGKANGFTGHLAKPFEPAQLLSAVQPYWPGAGDHGDAAGQTGGEGLALPDKHQEQALAAALAEQPEFDTVVLLRRFPGRLAFVARMLRQIAADCEQWTARLRQALDRQEFETARRQVHTLKGLAGTFAMVKLQPELVELEGVLKQEGMPSSAQIGRVDAALRRILAGVRALPEFAGDPGNGQLAEVLAALRRHLREGDGEAEDLWLLNKSGFAGLFTPRQMAEIDLAIGQWDFDKALAVLDRFGPGGETH